MSTSSIIVAIAIFVIFYIFMILFRIALLKCLDKIINREAAK